jgi:transposase
MMRFYEQQHPFYCGVDLHARTMHVCVLDHEGQVLAHQNIESCPDAFLSLTAPWRKRNMIVGCECMFAWYWLADLCQEQGMPFVLGHALYMKAIHGGKTKNDKIDSHKIAKLLRGGNFPLAYVYPKARRPTRDLLRRRMRLVHLRSEAMGHVQNTFHQYNLPRWANRIDRPKNREGLAERFEEPSLRRSMEIDLELIDHLEDQIRRVELHLEHTARVDDPYSLSLLRTIPGVGKVLGLLLLYEADNLNRFATPGQFLSYSRLVAGKHESAGKSKGGKGRKMGNRYLKWAFGEAATLMLRDRDEAQRLVERRTRRHSKARAMSHLARKLGRATYYVLKKQKPFDVKKFFANG